MFKDLPEGQTHFENDGCGCPDHNSTPESDNWKGDGELGKRFAKQENQKMRRFTQKEITSAYTRGKEETKKEILEGLPEKKEGMYCDDCLECHPTDSDLGSNECIDLIREKLK